MTKNQQTEYKHNMRSIMLTWIYNVKLNHISQVSNTDKNNQFFPIIKIAITVICTCLTGAHISTLMLNSNQWGGIHL
jgi:hypothetical protein